MTRRPVLKVIEGGAQATSRWLDFPQWVIAKSPDDPTGACVLRVSRGDSVKAAMKGRRQPTFEFWSVIMGVPPPVNAVRPVLPLCRLDQAHACFRGIERPLAEDDNGDNVLAYALKPLNFYRFDPTMAMASMATPCEVPAGILFVAYARLDMPCEPNIGGIIGALTHWGFVEADPANPALPVDWNSRYKKRLW